MKFPVMAAALLALFSAAPALAGMRVIDGQAFWDSDPGPVAPPPYFESGQAHFDPQHFLGNGLDPHDYKMVVYGDHAGAEKCVWRKRVVNTDWDYRHPLLKVCRR